MKTREDHKKELLASLRECDHTRIVEIRERAKRAIEHNHKCWERQNDNGMNVSLEQLGKNNARHWLEVQCCDIILEEAVSSYGDK